MIIRKDNLITSSVIKMTSVAVCGPTGIGKTTFVTSWCERNNKVPLFCRSLEDLKDLTIHNVIIFDDISFQLSRPELLIHLCDSEHHATVRCLHKAIKVKPEILKIFTHNNISAWRPVLASPEQIAAINRRLTIITAEARCDLKWAQLDELLLSTSTKVSEPTFM